MRLVNNRVFRIERNNRQLAAEPQLVFDNTASARHAEIMSLLGEIMQRVASSADWSIPAGHVATGN